MDVFFDTMSDFNVPGSRPKKHDEISEIDHEGIRCPRRGHPTNLHSAKGGAVETGCCGLYDVMY